MRIKGFIFAIISAIFFGSAGIFVKNGYSENFSPVDLLMLQYIIAGVILYLISIIKYKNHLRISRVMFKRLFIQGALLNTLMTVCFYLSFKYLEVSIATMLLFVYPVIVAISSCWLFNLKLSKKKIYAISGTFAGCILVLNVFGDNLNTLPLRGLAFGLLAAVFYAAMNIYAENIVDILPSVIVTFYTTIFSLLVLFIFNFSFIEKLRFLSVHSVVNAGLLAFICEIIPLTLLYSAIKYIGPVSASIISTLELPSSAILSFIFMKDKLSLLQIMGIIVIICSIILLKKDDMPPDINKSD